MTAPWLAIVGLGEDGLDGLSPVARGLLDRAEVLVGGARHLATVPEDGRQRLTWTRPLSRLVETIAERRGRPVAVLATGDPMHYGIGVTLCSRFPREELVIVPAPSAASLAAARLGWPLAEAEVVTLHGRPLALLRRYLQPGVRLLLLSEDGTTPAAVAGLLRDAGFGASVLWVLEHLGGPRERIDRMTAAECPGARFADLNTIALELVAEPGTRWLARTPGLPDEAFRNDGQLTKREARAIALAALGPAPGELLWDVGAGCGSIAIEWMRSDPRCRAIAIERNSGRCALIADNALALGVPRLDVRELEAPDGLDALPTPDAVFVGGGVSRPALVEACWRALKPGGRLVANAVTLDGETALVGLYERLGGQLSRLAVARADPIGAFAGWRPLMPVTQYAVVKPADGTP